MGLRIPNCFFLFDREEDWVKDKIIISMINDR
jgi:hypothetical protein